MTTVDAPAPSSKLQIRRANLAPPMLRRPAREMRNNQPRLRGTPQEPIRLRNPDPPVRKAFNCIVDDTALIAGLKKNTRDGIKKWVNMGAIRLFVPLHSLEHLTRLSKGKDRAAADAREALRWLDEITSLPNVEEAGIVQLQGPDQTYNTWGEVEKFLLPETLLSMDNTDHESEFLPSEIDALNIAGESDQASMSSSQSIDNRPTTPSSPRSTYSTSSPVANNASPFRPLTTDNDNDSHATDRTARNSLEFKHSEASAKGGIPMSLRALFNHILWLINQEENTDAALANYVFMTNDETKQTLAQRFGVRAKRLEQLRDIIAREDREYKNRIQMFKKENGDIATPAPPSPRAFKVNREVVPQESASDDEDVILLKPGSRGSTRTPPTPNGQPVLDPNEFSRGPSQPPARSERGGQAAARGGRRNGTRGPGSMNGSTRGGSTHQAPALPTKPVAGKSIPRGPRATADLSKPIDPDSFARPTAGRSLRGGRRKLWEPT